MCLQSVSTGQASDTLRSKHGSLLIVPRDKNWQGCERFTFCICSLWNTFHLSLSSRASPLLCKEQSKTYILLAIMQSPAAQSWCEKFRGLLYNRADCTRRLTQTLDLSLARYALYRVHQRGTPLARPLLSLLLLSVTLLHMDFGKRNGNFMPLSLALLKGLVSTVDVIITPGTKIGILLWRGYLSRCSVSYVWKFFSPFTLWQKLILLLYCNGDKPCSLIAVWSVGQCAQIKLLLLALV